MHKLCVTPRRFLLCVVGGVILLHMSKLCRTQRQLGSTMVSHKSRLTQFPHTTAGYQDSNMHSNLPTGSKLSALLGDCMTTQRATDTSKQAATRLASAFAMADASAYSLLLPWLEGMMWTGQSSSIQMIAAAGKTARLCHKGYFLYQVCF